MVKIMASQNNGQFRLISGVDCGWGRLSPEHIIPQGRLFLRVGYGRARLFSVVDWIYLISFSLCEDFR